MASQDQSSGYRGGWKRWLAIYAIAAVAIYFVVYLVFFHHGGGGGGGGY